MSNITPFPLTAPSAAAVDPDDYTVDELIAMDDEDFAEAVTEDLYYTGGHHSPFQDEAVQERTLTALIGKIRFTDDRIAQAAENPRVTPERFAKMQTFRSHLASVLDVTERRVDYRHGFNARHLSRIKAVLHEILDEIEGTSLDWILDSYDFPVVNQRDTPTPLTMRMWRSIRIDKDPSRSKVRDAA